MRRMLQITIVLFAAVFLIPIAVAATVHFAAGANDNWRSADQSSAGLLKPAAETPEAVVRIFSARLVRWRGIFATHSWIVYKPAGASAYVRFEKTAWGEPIRRDRFLPDARWFGNMPDVIYAADGPEAEALIPRIEEAIADYRFARLGDYTSWPGPNSNTFVTAIMTAIPEIATALPSTAIGKDFPYDGRWLSPTPSGTGWRLSLGGYAGLTIGRVEGLEINILGAVAGLDLARPGIKIPAFGRFGM